MLCIREKDKKGNHNLSTTENKKEKKTPATTEAEHGDAGLKALSCVTGRRV